MDKNSESSVLPHPVDFGNTHLLSQVEIKKSVTSYSPDEEN